MDYKEIFYRKLKETFIPALRELGFTGSGQNYRRVMGDVIHTVNIQNNKYGGSCCLNIGLHLSFLPVSWSGDEMPVLKKVKGVDCEFRKRVAPAGKTDYWWKFRGYGLFGSTAKSVAHLRETYLKTGEPAFSKYKSVDDVAAMLPLDLLASSNHLSPFGNVVPVRGALTMARIQKHLGNLQACREYAQVGLRILNRAQALKPELEKLANITEESA